MHNIMKLLIVTRCSAIKRFSIAVSDFGFKESAHCQKIV